MRRVVSRTATAACAARTYVTADGTTKYRIENVHNKPLTKETLDQYWSDFEATKIEQPRNRKEELAHLLERPDYERVNDFQRAATDMMAVQGDIHAWATDMGYHYQRIWKCNTASKTNMMDGNDAFHPIRIHPQ